MIEAPSWVIVHQGPEELIKDGRRYKYQRHTDEKGVTTVSLSLETIVDGDTSAVLLHAIKIYSPFGECIGQIVQISAVAPTGSPYAVQEGWYDSADNGRLKRGRYSLFARHREMLIQAGHPDTQLLPQQIDVADTITLLELHAEEQDFSNPRFVIRI